MGAGAGVALSRAERRSGVNTERWQRVRDLFEEALENPPTDLERWLAEHSDDPEVRAELASLLANHSKAGDFLSSPVGDRADLFEEESKRPRPPARLSDPIKSSVKPAAAAWVASIARSTRGSASHGRDQSVAARVAPDASQRERLRREARAAAALPTLVSASFMRWEEIDGELYIVSEFIEGQTLRRGDRSGTRPTVEADRGTRRANWRRRWRPLMPRVSPIAT